MNQVSRRKRLFVQLGNRPETEPRVKAKGKDLGRSFQVKEATRQLPALSAQAGADWEWG